MALTERAGLGDARTAFQLIQTTPGSESMLLERGDVDGAIAFEPIAGKLITSGKARPILGPFWIEWQKQTGTAMEMAGMATTAQWLSAHSAEAKKLITCWQETVDYINTHFDETLLANKDFTNLSTTEELNYARQWIRPAYVREWGQLDISIADQLKVLKHSKLLESDSMKFVRKIDL